MTHNTEECKSIFVSWHWLIGIIGTAALSVGGLCWAASAIVEKNSSDHKNYEKSLTGIERNGVKLDTIISMMRHR